VRTAGIVSYSAIAEGDVDKFDIATNLRGTFLAQAAEHVAAGGHIIAFFSSVNAKEAPLYGSYIAAKRRR
jgi:3-oxoacyl-[acyl-carrier protein] reductase